MVATVVRRIPAKAMERRGSGSETNGHSLPKELPSPTAFFRDQYKLTPGLLKIKSNAEMVSRWESHIGRKATANERNTLSNLKSTLKKKRAGNAPAKKPASGQGGLALSPAMLNLDSKGSASLMLPLGGNLPFAISTQGMTMGITDDANGQRWLNLRAPLAKMDQAASEAK